MTTIEARLASLAEKATPGPWHLDEPTDEDRNGHAIVGAAMPKGSAFQYGVVAYVYGTVHGDRDINARLIAACDPTTIARLCAVVSAARVVASDGPEQSDNSTGDFVHRTMVLYDNLDAALSDLDASTDQHKGGQE